MNIDTGMPIRQSAESFWNGNHVQVWANGELLALCGHQVALKLEKLHSNLSNYYYKYYQVSMMLVRFEREQIAPRRG